MGTGRSDPGILARRRLIRRRPSWKDLFWRATRLFRIVALTRKTPCFGMVRICSYLHYSKNLQGFQAFSEKSRPPGYILSLIHISEPTRLGMISYAVFCLKK